MAIARDQSSVYLQLLMHETQPPSQFTVSTITRYEHTQTPTHSYHIHISGCLSQIFFFFLPKFVVQLQSSLQNHRIQSFRNSALLFSVFARTYRGFNLSNAVPDVTLENNLSRVVTAVSHAFTSSTSRALTVRFQICITIYLFVLPAV